MAEGSTTVLFDESAHSIASKLSMEISKLGISDLQETTLDDEGLRCVTFEHNGTYGIDKMTKIVKSLADCEPGRVLRAYHGDEYGTEVFWLLRDGKLHKYQLDEEFEGPNIVKAYRHWHAGLGNIRFGDLDDEEIEIMAQRHGEFDEKGRKVKSGPVDFWPLLKVGEAFIGKGTRAPFAAAMWDHHIKVYESFAKEYARHCQVLSDDGYIHFERTYYVENRLGYVWTWKNSGRPVVLLLSFPGNLGMERNLVVNVGGLTLDELIILDSYGLIENNPRDGLIKCFNKYVEHYDPFECSEYVPPSTDYLYQTLPENFRLISEEWNFDGFVINVRCQLERHTLGHYYCSGRTPGGKPVHVNVYDQAFCQRLDALPAEKFVGIDLLDADLRERQARVISCELQAEFDQNLQIRRVLKSQVEALVSHPTKGLRTEVLEVWKDEPQRSVIV